MAHKTVVFLGASTGVGLAALKRTLAAGHRCIAICRVPSKLTNILPPESHPNLQVVEGNAHDVTTLSQSFRKEDGQLVDEIVSTIGGKLVMPQMKIDDKEVCRKGMAALLQALDQLRRNGATGRPHIVVCSTTGMSRFGRDTPVVIAPIL